MKSSFVRISRIGLLAATLGLGLIASAGSASATTSYTGLDPIATGCATGAVTMESATVHGLDGATVGTVELRYNTSCHAGWARLTLTGPLQVCNGHAPAWGCDTASALIHRNSDGTEEGCSVTPGQTSCWTNMVDDLNVTSYAKGSFYSIDKTYTATTPSY